MTSTDTVLLVRLNRLPTSTSEAIISDQHLTPIIVTGGATLAAIIVLSRTKQSKPKEIQPASLTNQNITTSFVAAIPEITPEINLELATATQTEVFTKTNRSFWGKSTVQIQVPVTYRYYICLRDPWQLEIHGNRVIVHAPEFQPSLPPAIHTDKMERLAVRGWARGSTQSLMEQLEKDITPALSQLAKDPRHLGLVRHQCRQSVAEFIKLWLEREHHHITEIQIVFPKEEDSPNLRLKH